jgi:CheY-like chemotaxis protein
MLLRSHMATFLEVVRAFGAGPNLFGKAGLFVGRRSNAESEIEDLSSETPGASRRVLVVADEPASGTRTARYFRTLGWTVDTAGGPVDVRSAADQHPHDLAILDLAGPEPGGSRGLDLLREIRDREPAARVIVLSADSSPGTEAQALGATAVMCKPYYLPDLGHLAFSLTGVFEESAA